MQLSKVIISVISVVALTSSALDVQAATTTDDASNIVTVTNYLKAPKVSHVKIGYISKKHAITIKGYGTFRLMSGTKSLKKITATRYSTPTLRLISAERTKTGMRYHVTGKKGAKIVIARKGKTIKMLRAAGKTTKITVKRALIKNSSKHLTMTQKASSLKTSRAIKLPALKVGTKTVVSYN